MPKKVDKIIDKSTSRKVYMSMKNAQRWISLKNHLSLITDDELLDYLLDLADSTIDQSSVQSRLVSSKDTKILHCNLPRSSSRKSILDDVPAGEKPKNGSSSQHVEKMSPQEHGTCLKPCSRKTRRNKNKYRRNKLKTRKHQKIRMFLKPELGSDSSVNQFSTAMNISNIHDELQFTESLENGVQSEFETNIEKPSDSGHSLTAVDVVNIDENLHDICQKQQPINESISENEDENVEKRITSVINVLQETNQNNATLCRQTDNIISTLDDAVNNSKVNMLSSVIEANEQLEPLHVIEDCISFDNWKNKYKNHIQVVKVIESQDPMSKGYSNGTNYIFESNNESNERYEEKQENIDANWPLFSRESLPVCLELRMTSMDHGLGIFAKLVVPMNTQFGPLIGQPIQEMDIPDDYSMKHIWEISASDKTLYVSTTNPLASNWIRYMRPAESQNEKTVDVFKKNGQLFFVTCKTLMTGTELLYWLDSPSDSWTRKNKMDKTNCGGCNLKFSHPIYYRLHCCIFHDTNYSLTIRKYHCKVCGTAVLGKDNIMKHAAQFHAGRGAYQCQYCKKFFLRLNYLEMHRTYGCSKNPSRSRPLCDFCGRKFCQPQKLKVHIKRMHSNTAEVLEEFQCKLCSKLLGSRAALARHMKEVHQKDVVGAAACDRCGKTFQNKSNLKIHMLTHSGVKPFECKENECRAAFTTKQCLQFHYKKVHGLSDEMMPKIERSIAYTFDAYSGGLVEDLGRGKIPKFGSDQKEVISADNQCVSSSSSSSLDLDEDAECSEESHDTVDLSASLRDPKKTCQTTIQDSNPRRESSTESLNSRQEEECTTSDIHGKWTSKLEAESCAAVTLAADTFDIDAALSSGGQSSDKTRSPCQIVSNDEKLESAASLCKRGQESLNASLLVEAALDAAERDIGVVSIPSLEAATAAAAVDNEQGSADLYVSAVPTELVGFKPVDYQVCHEAADVDSYVHADELVSSSTIPNSRQALPAVCSQYRSNGYVACTSNRLHSIEQYLVEQELATSPRYDEMAHLHSNANSQLQSQSHRDESDSVVQNLSLAVKAKSIMEISNYEPDYTSAAVNMAKVKFAVLQSEGGGAREQGLDMSARGLQQTCGSPVMESDNHLHHYHHHHHHHHHPHHPPFKMDENERHGVDLSISGPCVSPASYGPIYPPYSAHVDVPRVVNFEPTSKPHQLHTAVSRIIAMSPLAETCPPLSPPDAAPQVRILPSSASPPPIHAYNASATYSIGTAYHTPRPSGYHYCNYY